MTYYLLGVSGFIGKNYYLHLRNQKKNIICLQRDDLNLLKNAKNSDVVINFCGLNRGDTREEYEKANHYLLKEIVNMFNKDALPLLIHISSYMVNGFENVLHSNLPEYQKYFIESKRNGENFLINNYPKDRLCIIRPSNIYGYNCEPYYNNLLVTLIHEKLNKIYKITKINKNCERNYLSINGLIKAISDLIDDQKVGLYNIVSNQNLGLDTLISLIYPIKVPEELSINDGDMSIARRIPIDGESFIVQENINDNLAKLQQQMETIMNIKKLIKIEQRKKLSQSRGDMIEISNLKSKRLYMITLTDHSVRGNHYHLEQIEDFYIHKGCLMFLLAHKDDISTVYAIQCKAGDCITVSPPIIHTLVNDFTGQVPEIFITSTFPYIPNVVLDTVYINI
ncbi:MAG: NAD-dependent epimerase/dehydratase family protein [Candidatus Paceibacterota bacterium]